MESSFSYFGETSLVVLPIDVKCYMEGRLPREPKLQRKPMLQSEPMGA